MDDGSVDIGLEKSEFECGEFAGAHKVEAVDIVCQLYELVHGCAITSESIIKWATIQIGAKTL
jgi:hypothetical protein